jgi:hypothetical protein
MTIPAPGYSLIFILDCPNGMGGGLSWIEAVLLLSLGVFSVPIYKDVNLICPALSGTQGDYRRDR